MKKPEIVPGSRITLMKFNEFGFPVSIKMTFEEARIKDYAQYNDCLYIVGRPMRKRRSYSYLIKPNDSFTIFEGWVDHGETAKVERGDGYTVKSLGVCFDNSTLHSAMDVDAPVIMRGES